LAEHEGGIADVRAGQELAKADRLGEVRLREPATLFHHGAIGPRQDAAERARADGEKAREELGERARRRDLHFFLHNTSVCAALQRSRFWPLPSARGPSSRRKER